MWSVNDGCYLHEWKSIDDDTQRFPIDALDLFFLSALVYMLLNLLNYIML